jgi:hypothetical protein
MIFLKYDDFGCVYTIDEDTHELYYAPIYADDTVNFNEFAPVDLFCLDEDDTKVVLEVQQQLIALIK